MQETGKIKNIEGVKRKLRGRRYTVTSKNDSGVKTGVIDGMDGEYALYDEWLEPDGETYEIAIIGNYPELNEYPTIFLFSVPLEYGKAEVINLFEIGMDVAKSQSEDERIGIGMAASEYVCGYTGGTVKCIEPVGEIDIIM